MVGEAGVGAAGAGGEAGAEAEAVGATGGGETAAVSIPHGPALRMRSHTCTPPGRRRLRCSYGLHYKSIIQRRFHKRQGLRREAIPTYSAHRSW